MNSNKTILLTIDVEDWFQVENFRPWIPFETWDQCELRVERNVHRLLNLFDSAELKAPRLNRFHIQQGRHSSKLKADNQIEKNYELSAMSYELGYDSRPKATFFVLGWLAERLPNLVREIHSRGHEVASHGYNHNLANQQSHADLKQELTESKKMLEGITGSRVSGFRAPNFSINNDILKIIEDCGYIYDSSYNSFGLHGRYGQISLNGHSIQGIAHKITENFFELPISNIHFKFPLSFEPSALRTSKCIVLPWGGGAYFRLMPLPVFTIGLKNILKKENAYLFYLHPWEFDSEQPRVDNASHLSKLKHYTNIRQTDKKLKKLIKKLSHYQFITCSQYLDKNN
jgi:polysaccharide deacetylase family protein (PEP-CTERM system associated)